jgi:sugar phosphate isomerase/epimerase
MNKRSFAWVFMAAVLFMSSAVHGQKQKVRDIYANNNLAAWCIVPFDSQHRGPEERAKMLQSLGITKLAYDWRAEHIPTFDEELNTLKKYHIKLQGFWLGVGRDPANDKTLRLILDLFKRHHMKTQLWCLLGEDTNLNHMSQAQKVAYSAEPFAYIAREAAKIGCTVGLYNHEGWFGEPENQLAIIDYLKMPNVGMVYNFHHAAGQIDRFAEFFPKILPHLLALNISGLKKGPPGRVVPVGQGDAEMEMMRIVRDSKYKGPIGIINEATAPDAEVGLRLNMDGLKKILQAMGDTAALATYK